MKELPFPEGVKPLDIFVSSVNKRRLTEEFEGRSGTLNYGYDYGERSVDLSLWLEAHDTIDYRLIRNELYAFFDAHDVFYIEETRVPSRVLKVTIDESYIPERINQTHSSVEISCRTLDSVFWESKYTTLELHDSGYSATAEKYGLVDNIDDEKVKYRFEPDLKKVTLKSSDFEQGSISSATGADTTSTSEIRTVSYFETIPGETFTFKDDINGDSINYWWLFEYDENGGYLGYSNTPVGGNGELKFVAKGHRLRVRSVSYNGIKPEDVGVQTLPTIEGIDKNNKFTVYNAGNVTVEPESMYLELLFYYCTIPDGKMTVKNLTTGDVLEINSVENRMHIKQSGMKLTIGAVQRFRDTNRRFISLAPGDNQFEITGATFDEARFDFKYYYK